MNLSYLFILPYFIKNDLIKYNNDYQLQMQEAILNTEKAEADAIARLTEMWENNEITYDELTKILRGKGYVKK